MKNKPMGILLLLLLCNCVTLGAQIDSIPWTDSNISKLNQFDRAAVAAFLNRIGGSEGTPAALKPADIGEFKWIDLAGDGRCELALTLSTGPNFASLGIIWQDPKGGFSSQGIAGEGSLTRGIKDLDGDGKKEIIMGSYLDPSGISAGSPVSVWPQVYRLQDEKYVPASKDFFEFYEREVLPHINAEMEKSRRTLPPASIEPGVGALEMERDKILRVLGIDPQAGLEEARQWARSDNPEMIYMASCVLHDIPGHEAEAHAAKQAWFQALRRQNANAR